MLPEFATLSELSFSQLLPGQLPELWQSNCVGLNQLYNYFSGSNIVQIPREGYSDSLPIPSVERAVIDTAVSEAVKTVSCALQVGKRAFLLKISPLGAGRGRTIAATARAYLNQRRIITTYQKLGVVAQQLL